MRRPTGGRIDRSRTLTFTVDGEPFTAHAGDTVASALLASGRVRVGGSAYLGRPRGIVAAGVEEPNALIRVAGGDGMALATTTYVTDQMSVRLLSGLGALTDEPDDRAHDKRYVHADVVVVGAGPAGLAAALVAGRSGARVILIDDQPELGGSLLGSAGDEIDGMSALDWVGTVAAELDGLPEVTVLTSTTVLGAYDDGYLIAVEKRPAGATRLHHVRTEQTILATGAVERPLVFPDNDRPGVMLASAVRTYLHRYGVLVAPEITLLTNNTSTDPLLADLEAAGATVTQRRVGASSPENDAESAHLALDPDKMRRLEPSDRSISADSARHDDSRKVRRVGASSPQNTAESARLDSAPDKMSRLDANFWASCAESAILAVSGGWSPVVQLWTGRQGRTRWEPRIAAFVPVGTVRGMYVAGAANGAFDLDGCLWEGSRAGAEAATTAGFPVSAPTFRGGSGAVEAYEISPVWMLGEDPATSFVDLQRDQTVADVAKALGTGMRSVEHVKRYTSAGTGADQGKTSGLVTAGIVATLTGADIAEVGVSNQRPPYVPVSFAALAGRERGDLFDPERTTPIHDWHVAHGAVCEPVGQWLRPWYYPRTGESMDEAVARECLAVRTDVGMQDASTLGKIEIRGVDAGVFLDRVYTNKMSTLRVGAARYGLMCGVDGMILDDGVVLRLADDRFLATTTTGNAAKVLDWLEEWSQTEWPELDVTFASVTEQWTTIAVAGPRARSVIAAVAPDLDVSDFPFMTWRDTSVAGVPARVARISFSGELAYEVSVSGWHGPTVWAAISAQDVTPYGTEAMHVLRAEKGFIIVGQDTDGTVTPDDVGLGWAVSRTKDFIGRRSLARAGLTGPGRKQLVGLRPPVRLREGTQLVAPGADLTPPVESLGWVTSSYVSPTVGGPFALALVADGRERIGTRVSAVADGALVEVEVTDPVLYDPEGARRDG